MNLYWKTTARFRLEELVALLASLAILGTTWIFLMKPLSLFAGS